MKRILLIMALLSLMMVSSALAQDADATVEPTAEATVDHDEHHPDEAAAVETTDVPPLDADLDALEATLDDLLQMDLPPDGMAMAGHMRGMMGTMRTMRPEGRQSMMMSMMGLMQGMMQMDMPDEMRPMMDRMMGQMQGMMDGSGMPNVMPHAGSGGMMDRMPQMHSMMSEMHGLMSEMHDLMAQMHGMHAGGMMGQGGMHGMHSGGMMGQGPMGDMGMMQPPATEAPSGQ